MLAEMRALYTHRQLLGDFAWRELRSRYKGSALGFGWNFAMPLLQLVVFWVLFGVLFGIRPRTATGEEVNYAVFLFVGLLPWTFFANSLGQGAASIIANGAIVKKVRLPLQLLPAASVLSSLANFLLSLVVLFAVLAIFGPRHPEGLLVLPLLVVIELLLALGFAYLLAAANVFFRDVQHILTILLTAWYFLTPVLFSVSIVDGKPTERFLLYLNPMAAVIVSYQRALLSGLAPEWGRLAYSAVWAVAMFVLGFLYFARTKNDFEEAL